MLIDFISGFIQGALLSCLVVSAVLIVSFIVQERTQKDD